jgi:hypothetical protein
MINVSIVVARYNENIEWSNHFSNVIVYNKGKPLVNSDNEKLMLNVGKEGHTYYKHIYDNYDNLSDYIVFLQGNPFDHSPNIISNLKRLLNTDRLKIDFHFLSENILGCNLTGCKYHHPSRLPILETYKMLFNGKETEMEFEFGAGAQFIVNKELILKKTRSFYLKIVKLLEHSKNPFEGYVIERFHKLIFTHDVLCDDEYKD